MNIEINASEEQSNGLTNRWEENYFQYLADIKSNDSEDFEEDFGAVFMFL